MKSAGKARNNGLYRHIRTSKEIIRNLLNDSVNSNIMFLLRNKQSCQFLNNERASRSCPRVLEEMFLYRKTFMSNHDASEGPGGCGS